MRRSIILCSIDVGPHGAAAAAARAAFRAMLMRTVPGRPCRRCKQQSVPWRAVVAALWGSEDGWHQDASEQAVLMYTGEVPLGLPGGQQSRPCCVQCIDPELMLLEDGCVHGAAG